MAMRQFDHGPRMSIQASPHRASSETGGGVLDQLRRSVVGASVVKRKISNATTAPRSALECGVQSLAGR